MTQTAQHMEAELSIDVRADSPLWDQQPDAEDILRRAILAARRDAAQDDSERGEEISVLLAGDADMQRLNRQWRDQDKPTNVLSFPSNAGAGADGIVYRGDIVLAFETIEREASADQKTFADHLAHLAIHGYLHLIGFDHETDQEAETMERLETRILGRLGISDPYASKISGN